MLAQTQILIVMVTYLGLLIAWGIYQGRLVKTDSDFSIAGRSLPGWAAALSERATGESSWALLGLPGAAYATGLMEVWTALGCVAGIVTAWAVLSWRLRDEAEKFNIKTYTDYLAKKYGDAGRWIRVVSSLTIVFFFFFYVGAQFLGGGKTLFAMFEIKPQYGMLLMAAVVISYTIYGGFRSVAYTDSIQAVIMITTLVVGPIAGIFYLASHPDLPFFAHTMEGAIRSAGPGYSSLTGGASGFAAGVVIVGGFSWFFGYLGGQPQLSMRFMAIKDMRQAKKARNIGIVWTLFAYVGALSLGWIGVAIFGPNGLADQESVMPRVILEIFPPAIAGLLITGVIAAIVSSADSLLIVSATELSENIIKPAFRKPVSPGRSLALSRIITLVLALIALGMAYLSPSRLIFTMVSYVWAGIGGTFSVVILLTLFWKKYHGRAVVATIITGMTFTIIWTSTGMEQVVTSRLLTFFVTGAAAVAATLLLPKRQ